MIPVVATFACIHLLVALVAAPKLAWITVAAIMGVAGFALAVSE